MKRFALLALVVLGVLALTLVRPTAQEQRSTIVFVDSQAAINAHPAGQAASDLQAQAREEIGLISADIDALNRRALEGQELSSAERGRLQVLIATLEAVQERYQSDIATTAQPALDRVNAVIRELAMENNYTIVLDAVVASNGLVVFAQDGLDITPLVLERIRQAGP
ncbi:MAG: OmpH family outer membrane protein [Truepera sp.]|nr:OmpH family outer membrane protein [Truepera sp.]